MIKVKRSVTHDEYVKSFNKGSNIFSLVRPTVNVLRDARPSESNPVACDSTMRKPVSGNKLRNIIEMYDLFVPRYRLTAQLVEAIQTQDGTVNTESEKPNDPANSQFDAKSMRVGLLIETANGAASAHSFLRRVAGVNKLSDEDLAERVSSSLNSGIRTMPNAKAPKGMNLQDQAHLAQCRKVVGNYPLETNH